MDWPIAAGAGRRLRRRAPWTFFPANHDGHGRQGQHLPLPERRRGAAATCRRRGTSGPSNYHFSTGDGSPGSGRPATPGATRREANGAFILGRPQSVATITRRVEQHGGGLRAAASARPRATPPTRPAATPARTSAGRIARGRSASARTTPAALTADRGWRLDKGNGWWDGDYRSTLYNHYLTPNAEASRLLADQPAAQPGVEGRPEQPPRRRQRAVLRRPRRDSSRTR